MTVTLTLHVVATLYLVGMIWTVQIVHYPLFRLVGDATFVAYEAAHASRITAVIVVPWALQGATTLAMLVSPPEGVPREVVGVAAVLAVLPVLVTVIASVPAHATLSRGFDPATHARLVRTNWLRTAAWTAHGGVVTGMLVLTLRAA